ncbi:MAG: autotransporter outer membrane beta-barrel domain-containing protein [Lactobacillaceae bacterium]|jgi:outer membrane autotransporter protein|nr:autotransporter outer membrane beta-barrel domain-containing protein [Lactobacillaceae bacterium]
MVKFNKLLLTSTIIVSSLIYGGSAMADQLTAAGDETISGDMDYSNNPGSYGISGTGIITFDGSITVGNNQEGILVSSGDSLTLKNSDQGKSLSITSSDVGIKNSGGTLAINDMDVNIVTSGSSTTGSSIAIDNSTAGGGLSFQGTSGQGNTLRINFASNIDSTAYYGLKGAAGATTSFTDMNISVDGSDINSGSDVNFVGLELSGLIESNSGSEKLSILANKITAGGGSTLYGVNMLAGAVIKNTAIEILNNKVTGDFVGIGMNGQNTIIGMYTDDGSGGEGGGPVFGEYPNASGSTTLTIVGNSANNGSSATKAAGIEVNGSDNVISGMDIAIRDNVGVNQAGQTGGGYGIVLNSGSNLSILSSNEAMDGLVFGNNSHADINNNGGTISISNMNIYSEGDSQNGVRSFYTSQLGNSTAQISGGYLYVKDNDVFAFGKSGIYSSPSLNNVINLEAVQVVVDGGAYLLNVLNGSSAELNISSSNVKGSVQTTSGSSSTINLTNQAEWMIAEHSDVTNISNDSSIINLKSTANGIYNTLTVKNYAAGEGATIAMNFKVNDQKQLEADKLVIESGGSVTGTTELDLYNTGDDVSTNSSVKLVDVQSGATVGGDAFVIKGGQIDNTAYVYKLEQGSGGDQSYYLRSNGKLTNMAETLINEPILISMMAKTAMNSVMKRMGELREDTPYHKNGAWVRSYAKDLEVSDMITTNVTFYGIEAGYDYKQEVAKNTRVYLGGLVGYIHTGDISTDQTNGDKDGSGNGQGANFGVYATISNDMGWFVDGVVRHFYEDFDMTSYTAGGTEIKFKPKRQMTAVGLEVGKQNFHYTNRDFTSAIIFEPKLQLIYAKSSMKDITTNLGNSIQYGDTTNITGKASIMLGYKAMTYNRTVFEPYIQAGILHEFDGKTDVNYNGVDLKSDMGGTGFEFGGGINVKMSASSALYMQFMYETGDVVKATSGNVGFRFTW